MRIVVRHNEDGLWWWAALSDRGEITAVSAPYASRTDCMRGVVELKVEGPVAPVTTEESVAPAPHLVRSELLA
jgi:uncharacterized protein YegP (UPF0339 family)